MLRQRLSTHLTAVFTSATISILLLAFVGVTGARSAAAQQIPTLNAPGQQMVTVVNHAANTMNFTGHIQLNLFNGPTASTLNQATTIGTCVACETLAVAVQINVASSHTSLVSATNNAIALNRSCLSCLTEADALQFWILAPQSTVTVPSTVSAFIAQMNHEFWVLENQSNVTPSSAIAGINGVLSQNGSLLVYLTTRFAQTSATNSPGA